MHQLIQRFIPTRVGNTRRSDTQATHLAVHPHSRGEHLSGDLAQHALPGSSPLAWGTLPTHANAGASLTVHPHSRGEHRRRRRRSNASCGSSPLAWGTLPGRQRHGAQGRFIPTRVGNTPQHGQQSGCLSVHPHSRGEHISAYIRGEFTNGSSPLAWGTRCNAEDSLNSGRFIPTRVGNTSKMFLANRLRGGSSPLAWGTRLPAPCPPRRRRFIPTRVGNTFSSHLIGQKCSVHPHSREEHSGLVVNDRDDYGSSPLAWGTQVGGGLCFAFLRFIPTRVGNTVKRFPTLRPQPVHPHSRGEHLHNNFASSVHNGSSPLEWGTQSSATAEVMPSRFIPTRVGNTDGSAYPSSRLAVHPHSRGEHNCIFCAISASIGSSPLAWGTRWA